MLTYLTYTIRTAFRTAAAVPRMGQAGTAYSDHQALASQARGLRMRRLHRKPPLASPVATYESLADNSTANMTLLKFTRLVLCRAM